MILLADFPPAMLVGQNIQYLLYAVKNLLQSQIQSLPPSAARGNCVPRGGNRVARGDHGYRGTHVSRVHQLYRGNPLLSRLLVPVRRVTTRN